MTQRRHHPVESALQLRLPLLGVSTTFTTSSAEILDAIRAIFGSWEAAVPDEVLRSGVDATVRIELLEDVPGVARISSYRHFVPDSTLLLAVTDGGIGVADTLRREAVLYVTPDLVSRRAAFADGMLEPLTLFVLAGLDRQPVHAAAIVRDDVAILLAGPSGSGKSTLTYAASRGGYAPLADEPVYVQLEPVLRVWGRRPRIHLTEEARNHFPELLEHKPTHLPSGKSKIVVEPEGGRRPYADRPGLCILARDRRGGPRLERMMPEEAVGEMMRRLDEGYDIFADTIAERIRPIAKRGAWRLAVSDRPDDALPLLDEIASELERGR